VKARTLTVRNQIVQIGWKAEEGAPKTAASEARVSYDAATAEVLKAHRKAQVADQLEWGDAWVDSGKVFTRENGEPLHPAMATDQFERLAHAAGLPPIRLHDLRHGAATLGFAAGLDIKVVSAMLRHSSVSITADLYALILPDVAAQASEAVAKLVPRKAAK
jgi:integrase